MEKPMLLNRKPTIEMRIPQLLRLKAETRSPLLTEEDVRAIEEDPGLLERDTVPQMAPAKEVDENDLTEEEASGFWRTEVQNLELNSDQVGYL